MPHIPRTYMSAAGLQSETERKTLGRIASKEVHFRRQVELYRQELSFLIHDTDRGKKVLAGSMHAYSNRVSELKERKRRKHEEKRSVLMTRIKENQPDVDSFLNKMDPKNKQKKGPWGVTDGVPPLALLEDLAKGDESTEPEKPGMVSSMSARTPSAGSDGVEDFRVAVSARNSNDTPLHGRVEGDIYITDLIDGNIDTDQSGYQGSLKGSGDRQAHVKVTRSDKLLNGAEEGRVATDGLPALAHKRYRRANTKNNKTKSKKGDQLFMELLRIKQKQGLSKRLSIVDRISSMAPKGKPAFASISEQSEIYITEAANDGSVLEEKAEPTKDSLKIKRQSVYAKSPSNDSSISHTSGDSLPNGKQKQNSNSTEQQKERFSFMDTVENVLARRKKNKSVSYDAKTGHNGEADHEELGKRHSKRGSIVGKIPSLPRIDEGNSGKVTWQDALRKVRECHRLSSANTQSSNT